MSSRWTVPAAMRRGASTRGHGFGAWVGWSRAGGGRRDCRNRATRPMPAARGRSQAVVKGLEVVVAPQSSTAPMPNAVPAPAHAARQRRHLGAINTSRPAIHGRRPVRMPRRCGGGGAVIRQHSKLSMAQPVESQRTRTRRSDTEITEPQTIHPGGTLRCVLGWFSPARRGDDSESVWVAGY